MNKRFWFLLLSILSLSGICQKKIELVVQSGHYDKIQALTFSPNDKYLASAGKDNKVIIWDLKTGKEFRELKAHENGVKKLLFTKNGKHLLSGGDSRDQKLILWDWRSGEIIWQIDKAAGNSIESIAISPDGKKVATGTYHELRVRDLATGELLYELTKDRSLPEEQIINHTVEAIAFSPDNEFFAMGTYGKGVMIRKVSDGSFVQFIDVKEHRCGQAVIAWGKGKDKDKIYISGSLNQITVWNHKTGKLIEKIEHSGSGSGGSCRFTPDMNQFIIGSTGEITVTDLTTKAFKYDLEVFPGYSEDIAISHNSKLVAVSGVEYNDDASIKIINLSSQQEVQKLQGHANSIKSIDFNSDGKMIAAGSASHFARVWNISTSAGFKNYDDQIYMEGDVYSEVKFTKDDKQIIQSIQHSMWVWDVASTEHFKNISDGVQKKHGLAISNDGKYMAQTRPRLYDIASYERLAQMEAPRLNSRSIGFSSDSKYLYCGGYKDLKVYDVEKKEVIKSFETKGYVQTINSYPDSKNLLIDDYGEVKIINAKNGETVKVIAKSEFQPTLSPNAKYIATLDKNLGIKIYNGTSHELLHTLIGHDDKITDIVFSPNEKILASSSDDTSIMLWDLETGKLIARMLALDKEDYIIVTPDNYYMTSKGGVKGVAFRIGNKVFPFEQFDLHYNRPDIVLKRIGLAPKELIDAYKRSYQKRLKKAGFEDGSFNNDFHVPELKINNLEEIPYDTDQGKITLNVDASDSKYNLDRLMIWNNDVPIFGMNGKSIKANKSNSYIGKVNLDLAHGKNKIQIAVMNSNGIESYKETININYGSEFTKPNLYVLAIGATDFKDKQYNLTYPAKDAEDFVKTLQLSEAFSSVNVQVVTGTDVVKANVLKQRSFLEQAGTDDLVMIFIAGHGVLDSEFDYYFATNDMDFGNPSLKGIQYSELESLLDGLKAIRKLLFMDTCHSGELDKDEIVEDLAMTETTEDVVFRNVGVGVKNKETMGAYNTSELMKSLFTDLRRGTGATVISSAGGVEFAMESDEWKNGLFTYCLLNGLKGDLADYNDDNAISISELQKYVISTVSKLSKGKQIPTSRLINLTMDYRLW